MTGRDPVRAVRSPIPDPLAGRGELLEAAALQREALYYVLPDGPRPGQAPAEFGSLAEAELFARAHATSAEALWVVSADGRIVSGWRLE